MGCDATGTAVGETSPSFSLKTQKIAIPDVVHPDPLS
jgi:hypothetical protein